MEQAKIMNKITVNLDRGLGNQLFTFHAGLALAAKKHLPLHVDLSGTQNEKESRNSSIENLEISVHGANFSILWLDRTKSPIQIFIERAIHKFGKSSSMGRKCMRQYRSLTYGYDRKLYGISTPTQIWGNYQSYKYPIELEEVGISVEIRAKNPSNWYLQKRKEAEENSPISIHMRRGDYSNYKDDLGLLTKEYFMNAAQEYLKSHERGSRPIWIFSDNLEEAKNLGLALELENVSIVMPPNESSSAESLLLMSLSSVIITSNSSFSWWAGWLGRENNHVVIPKPYYKSFSGEFVDHIPPNWNSFPSEFL